MLRVNGNAITSLSLNGQALSALKVNGTRVWPESTSYTWSAAAVMDFLNEAALLNLKGDSSIPLLPGQKRFQRYLTAQGITNRSALFNSTVRCYANWLHDVAYEALSMSAGTLAQDFKVAEVATDNDGEVHTGYYNGSGSRGTYGSSAARSGSEYTVSVALNTEKTYTDVIARLFFKPVPPGNYSLTVSSIDASNFTLSGAVTVTLRMIDPRVHAVSGADTTNLTTVGTDIALSVGTTQTIDIPLTDPYAGWFCVEFHLPLDDFTPSAALTTFTATVTLTASAILSDSGENGSYSEIAEIMSAKGRYKYNTAADGSGTDYPLGILRPSGPDAYYEGSRYALESITDEFNAVSYPGPIAGYDGYYTNFYKQKTYFPSNTAATVTVQKNNEDVTTAVYGIVLMQVSSWAENENGSMSTVMPGSGSTAFHVRMWVMSTEETTDTNKGTIYEGHISNYTDLYLLRGDD